MLRVTLEIVPFGIEERKRTIGTMKIGNVGGNHATGDYEVTRITDDKVDTCGIHSFERRRRAWALVMEALKVLEE